jgi:hypothetical protein
VSGSMSCEAADGGGHTLSWNIEPDSDARTRNRRGEEVETLGGRACACDDCEREYIDWAYGPGPGPGPGPVPPPWKLPTLLLGR